MHKRPPASQDHNEREQTRLLLASQVSEGKGKGPAAPPPRACTEQLSVSRQWAAQGAPTVTHGGSYDASFRPAGSTRLDTSKVKWAQLKVDPMHSQIVETLHDDILAIYKGHQVREAPTSKGRIRIIINGDEYDKANITFHNIFATIMTLGQTIDAYFSMIHASFDTDDRMPAAPTWFDATFEDEKCFSPSSLPGRK